MSTQSPMPQNDPLLIAFQTLKHTPEYQNAVKWTIAANSAGEADGELWFAFAAGWSARMDYAREKKEALIAKCPRCGKSKLAAKFEICCM